MIQTKIESWFYFFLGSACFLIPGGVAIFIAYDRGISFVPVLMFTGTVIWAGLFWLLPFAFGKLGKRKKKVTFDERDQLIQKKSVITAYVVLWLYFVTASVTAWSLVGPQGSISVNIMPLTLLGGLVIFTFTQGLASTILYGRSDKGEKYE